MSKESLKGLPPIPGGIFEFRVDGFKPKFSKGKDSVNLNPIIKIINNNDPELNNKPIFENLNTNAGWVMNDFIHALGLEMVDNGDNVDIPGEFTGPDSDPSKWVYNGPILGRTGTVELVQIEYEGKKQTKPMKYFCQVAGCQVKHSDQLTKAS
jgi:hypothetical protein